MSIDDVIRQPDDLIERRRQVAAEGWTPEHDDQHEHGEMAAAAGCYALNTYEPLELITDDDGQYPKAWPWGGWWKPKDPRRDLIRAAALIVAEIERLDRADG